MYKREKVVKEDPIPWCSLSYKGINTHQTESQYVTSVLYQVMKHTNGTRTLAHLLSCNYLVNIYIYIYIYIYRVSQEECARLREGVPYVKVHQYNPKHLCPKLNGHGDDGQ